MSKLLNSIGAHMNKAHKPKPPASTEPTPNDADATPSDTGAAPAHSENDPMHAELAQHLSPAQHLIVKGIMAKHKGL